VISGSAPVSDPIALRDALSHMRITSPDGIPFEQALAEANGWSLDFAERVADEYCGFLYLAATAGFEVTPSKAVDQAWHLHLEWPHYREILCRDIIGRTLEHRPGTGEPDDEARCQAQYAQTLALYEQVFGKPPPADIWPSPFAADEEPEALDSAEDRTRGLSRRASFGSLIGSVTMFAFGAPMLGILLAGAALVFFIGGQPPAPGGARRNYGSCGSGACGGGTGGSSDDCGASCGGSCGGGGCGGGCGGD
jgi:uncharacterized membrane protein YgcG